MFVAVVHEEPKPEPIPSELKALDVRVLYLGRRASAPL